MLTYTVTGEGPILAKLDKRQGRPLARTLYEARQAGADALVPYIRAESPVRTSTMRGSVSTRGTTAGPRIWYRHFVVKGTRRGVRANPFVGRGARKGRGAARGAFEARVKADIR